METRLDGRVALVTGAGSGIGEATALLLAKQGARVATLSRSRDELEKVVAKIEERGGAGLVVVADISKPEELEAAVTKIIDTWGRLDIVFANAGINGMWAPIEDLKPEEFQKTLDVNVLGTFLTLKYTVPYLKEQEQGAIVITSSVNGTRKFSLSGATAYASSKAAQVAMAKMLALELADAHIRVNVICPGAITTQIDENTSRRNLDEVGEPVEYPEGNIPLTDGQPGSSKDVAHLVLFLVSDASSHITGTPVWIDGGETLLQG